jgi:hypothetical protein
MIAPSSVLSKDARPYRENVTMNGHKTKCIQDQTHSVRLSSRRSVGQSTTPDGGGSPRTSTTTVNPDGPIPESLGPIITRDLYAEDVPRPTP